MKKNLLRDSISIAHNLKRKTKIFLLQDKTYFECIEDSISISSNLNKSANKLYILLDTNMSNEYQTIFETINDWFIHISKEDLEKPEKLSHKLKFKLDLVNSKIYHNGNNKNLISLTMAIVLDNNTIITTIGNPRTYLLKDGSLRQISEDQTRGWISYQKGQITKEELKINSNNKLMNALGYAEVNFQKPDIKIISNDSYDTLLLFNSKITDLLSDDKIQVISKNTSKEYLADKIIDEAANINNNRKLSTIIYTKVK